VRETFLGHGIWSVDDKSYWEEAENEIVLEQLQGYF